MEELNLPFEAQLKNFSVDNYGNIEIGWSFGDNKMYGSIDRTFNLSAEEVDNVYFTIDENYQGGGLATELAATLEPWYGNNGLKRIKVHANIDVGGYCTPLRSRILTRDGWKKWDEVEVGDDTLGWDAGVLRWTPVLEIAVFPELPMTRMYNSRWSVDSTPEHRWVTRTWNGKQWGEAKLGRQTKSLARDGQRIVVTAPLQADNTSGLTPDQAALLAWLVTDGNVYMQNRRGYQEVQASIAQEKVLGRAALVTLGLRLNPRGANVPAVRLRELYAALDLPYGSPLRPHLEAIVLRFGKAQLDAFCLAGMQAEGDHNRPRFWQQPGAVADAFTLAFFLQGKHVTTTYHKGGAMLSLTASANPYVQSNNLRHEVLAPEPAWCPRTALGTWVMEQDGQVMLTGNTWAKLGFEVDPEEGYGDDPRKQAINHLISSVADPDAPRVLENLWRARVEEKIGEGYGPELDEEQLQEIMALFSAMGVDLFEETHDQWRAELEDNQQGVIDEILEIYRDEIPSGYQELHDTLNEWANALQSGYDDDLPSMYDIAIFGQNSPLAGESVVKKYKAGQTTEKTITSWPGKDALLGMSWYGVKTLNGGEY
jgi:GNAT superfamily N-acetyltransferase